MSLIVINDNIFLYIYCGQKMKKKCSHHTFEFDSFPYGKTKFSRFPLSSLCLKTVLSVPFAIFFFKLLLILNFKFLICFGDASPSVDPLFRTNSLEQRTPLPRC